MDGLTVRDAMILDFEGNWWRYEAVKGSAVRELFGVGPAAYYAELHRLIQRPEALVYAPMTVRRLRRLREQRRSQRSDRAARRRIEG